MCQTGTASIMAHTHRAPLVEDVEVSIKQSNGDQWVAIIWFESDQLDQPDHWQTGVNWGSALILIRFCCW